MTNYMAIHSKQILVELLRAHLFTLWSMHRDIITSPHKTNTDQSLACKACLNHNLKQANPANSVPCSTASNKQKFRGRVSMMPCTLSRSTRHELTEVTSRGLIAVGAGKESISG